MSVIKTIDGDTELPQNNALKEVFSADNVDVLLSNIIRRYGRVLQNYLQARVPIGEEGEDIAQEVYIRIANKKPDIMELQYPKAYLLQTAQNILHDRARLNSVQQQKMNISLDDSISANLCGAEPTPEHQMQQAQSVEQFQIQLNKLPLKCRNIFILNRFKGMSYEQIASHYGITNSAVQKHMMQAIKHFNQMRKAK